MKRLSLLLPIFVLVCNGCYFIKRIPKQEAINKAEAFIAEQGFTNRLINIDSTRTRIDVTEMFFPKDQVANFRYNSLNPNAVYAGKYGLGWLVAFTSKRGGEQSWHEDTTKIVTTAVIVGRNGNRVHMEHQGYLVDKSQIIKQ